MTPQPYRTGSNLTGLQQFASDHIRPGMTILEIGAFVGDSTNVFLDAGASVLSVDPWNEQMPGYHVNGSIFDAWLANTRGGASWHKGTGADFFAVDHCPRFDLAYIDAVHTYEAVCDDIAGCLKLLKPNGKLSGHDYCPRHFPGVMQAVNEWADKLGRTVKTYPDTSWIIA